MLTETQKKVLAFLVETLQKHNIVFQVSGGLAAIVHGSSRTLHDIDLEIHKADVETVRTLFKEFITEDWNNDLEGPEDQFDIWMMKLEIEGVPIDINQVEEVYIISKTGERTLQPSDMDTEPKEFDGMTLPVLRKEPLISYKEKLGREVDLEDVSQLLQKRKTIKFRDFLVELVQKGEKDSTWRLFDDKDLQKGDEVDLINWNTGEKFADAVLTEVREKQLGQLETADFEGHEKFESEEAMYAAYRTYYSDPVGPETIVKIIRFEMK